jgi:hypothetical protein
LEDRVVLHGTPTCRREHRQRVCNSGQRNFRRQFRCAMRCPETFRNWQRG